MVDQNILALIRRLETTLARQRSMVLATEAQLAAAVAIKDAQNELPLPAGSGPAKRSGT